MPRSTIVEASKNHGRMFLGDQFVLVKCKLTTFKKHARCVQVILYRFDYIHAPNPTKKGTQPNSKEQKKNAPMASKLRNGLVTTGA